MADVQIVVPAYKEVLNAREAFALDHSLSVLAAHPCTFIAPIGLDISYYAKRYEGSFRFYETGYFASVQDYSRLLVSVDFYQGFKDVEFLLILQPDVYIFRDDLKRWIESPFDYVGAPWPNGFELCVRAGKFASIGGKLIKIFVGNGGFSLRRREKCISLLHEHAEIATWFVKTGSNEDLFFSTMGALSRNFVLPNQVMASQFSVELDPTNYFELNDRILPMGVHAWEKYCPDFWRAHMPPWPDMK